MQSHLSDLDALIAGSWGAPSGGQRGAAPTTGGSVSRGGPATGTTGYATVTYSAGGAGPASRPQTQPQSSSSLPYSAFSTPMPVPATSDAGLGLGGLSSAGSGYGAHTPYSPAASGDLARLMSALDRPYSSAGGYSSAGLGGGYGGAISGVSSSSSLASSSAYNTNLGYSSLSGYGPTPISSSGLGGLGSLGSLSGGGLASSSSGLGYGGSIGYSSASASPARYSSATSTSIGSSTAYTQGLATPAPKFLPMPSQRPLPLPGEHVAPVIPSTYSARYASASLSSVGSGPTPRDVGLLRNMPSQASMSTATYVPRVPNSSSNSAYTPHYSTPGMGPTSNAFLSPQRSQQTGIEREGSIRSIRTVSTVFMDHLDDLDAAIATANTPARVSGPRAMPVGLSGSGSAAASQQAQAQARAGQLPPIVPPTAAARTAADRRNSFNSLVDDLEAELAGLMSPKSARTPATAPPAPVVRSQSAVLGPPAPQQRATQQPARQTQLPAPAPLTRSTTQPVISSSQPPAPAPPSSKVRALTSQWERNAQASALPPLANPNQPQSPARQQAPRQQPQQQAVSATASGQFVWAGKADGRTQPVAAPPASDSEEEESEGSYEDDSDGSYESELPQAQNRQQQQQVQQKVKATAQSAGILASAVAIFRGSPVNETALSSSPSGSQGGKPPSPAPIPPAQQQSAQKKPSRGLLGELFWGKSETETETDSDDEKVRAQQQQQMAQAGRRPPPARGPPPKQRPPSDSDEDEYDDETETESEPERRPPPARQPPAPQQQQPRQQSRPPPPRSAPTPARRPQQPPPQSDSEEEDDDTEEDTPKPTGRPPDNRMWPAMSRVQTAPPPRSADPYRRAPSQDARRISMPEDPRRRAQSQDARRMDAYYPPQPPQQQYYDPRLRAQSQDRRGFPTQQQQQQQRYVQQQQVPEMESSEEEEEEEPPPPRMQAPPAPKPRPVRRVERAEPVQEIPPEPEHDMSVPQPASSRSAAATSRVEEESDSDREPEPGPIRVAISGRPARVASPTDDMLSPPPMAISRQSSAISSVNSIQPDEPIPSPRPAPAKIVAGPVLVAAEKRKPRPWADLAGAAPAENAPLPYDDDDELGPTRKGSLKRGASASQVDWTQVGKKDDLDVGMLIPPIFGGIVKSSPTISEGSPRASEDYQRGNGSMDGEGYGEPAAAQSKKKKKGFDLGRLVKKKDNAEDDGGYDNYGEEKPQKKNKSPLGFLKKSPSDLSDAYGGPSEEKSKSNFLQVFSKKDDHNDVSDAMSIHSHRSFQLFKKKEKKDPMEDDAASLSALSRKDSDGKKKKKIVSFFKSDKRSSTDGGSRAAEPDSPPPAAKGRRKSLIPIPPLKLGKSNDDSDDDGPPQGTVTKNGEYLFPGEVALMKEQAKGKGIIRFNTD